ncbi:MAG: class I SAM-dependent DNA methyltransferase [Caldilineaceae bacterium]
MDLNTLQSWLWRAASSIRGEVDAARYKDYILPLVFYKRIDDVYADEVARVGKALGVDDGTAELFVEADRNLVHFYLPHAARWRTIRGKVEGLGEKITDNLRSIARENPELVGVIDRRDFNATEGNQRVLDDNTLARLVNILHEQRLGLGDVERDVIGSAYEYMLRKFAERGSSAGEFFTPTEVGHLLAYILDPEDGDEIHDPAVGSAGLLIKAALRQRAKVAARLGKPLEELAPGDVPQPVQLYGQELQADNVAAAKMNAFIHDLRCEIRQGNTMRNPAFVDAGGGLRRFRKIAANPMWNQDFAPDVYNNDTYDRFGWGIPPAGTADWGWLQHMYAALAPGGRMAVVLDTGAASRGSGNKGRNAERDIRKQFVDHDAIECVILLPENLFFNTSAPGIIIVAAKPEAGKVRQHAGEILLVNASKYHIKGRPKNYMAAEQVIEVGELFVKWQANSEISAIVSVQDVVGNDYNLSPSRYVAANGTELPMSLEEAVVLLREAEDMRRVADERLAAVLSQLGLS